MAGIYIVFGGLRAVVINDVLQALMIFLGACVIAALTFAKIPSWEAVREAAAENALHLMQPAGDPTLPWPGVFTGVLIVGIYFWCTNQFMIQRALGARTLDDGRWGALFAGLLKLPNLFILIIPGVLATVLYPALENPDLVFPTLVFDLLPVGVRGLMLAAMAAAILSSLEAILNSASTLFTMDFVQTLRPGSSQRQLVRWGRGATLGFMIASAAWAPQIAHWPTLWQYLQSILGYVTPPVVAVFLGGIFWPRANRHGAFATLCFGLPVGLAAWFANEILHLTTIQFLYGSAIVFVLSLATLVAISLCSPAPPVKTARHTWSRRHWSAETRALKGRAWYANYRFQGAGLLALTAAVVVYWL
jgi:SSS family solute:Na+ symporter